MNYEETVELEKNVKIKNEAEKICREFKNNVQLKIKDYSNGKFKIWSDSHNAVLVVIDKGVFKFQCRFLHESYDIDVTPECVFSKIKSEYGGIRHLIAHSRPTSK